MAVPLVVLNALAFTVALSSAGGCMVFIREVLREAEEVLSLIHI